MTARSVRTMCVWLAFAAIGTENCHGQDNVKAKATLREVLSIRHGGEVLQVSISPDGKRLLTHTSTYGVATGSAKVWDADTGKLLLTLDPPIASRICLVQFSTDSKRIICVNWVSPQMVIKVWDATTGKLVAADVRLDRPRALDFPVLDSGGSRLVARQDDDLLVWDTRTGKNLLSFRAEGKGSGFVAVSADGKLLASGTRNGTVAVWGIDAGKELHALKGHTGSVEAVAFRPDGKRLVSATYGDDNRREVKLWNAETGKLVFDLDTRGIESQIRRVGFSPNGKLVAATNIRGAMKIWDVETGKEVLAFKAYKNEILSFAFHPDGKRFVTLPDLNPVQVWELKR